ncbi:MAG: UDP-2,4-diacetamido-2,4,6-trideoxy-beta-L-altropyranose hydrolase [Lachnospiraceae bacterium]|nr:UDP-2,4-diacetamido-2,4,6-trideoxy-beta-L-altropyranose hydrolase [Lachnospiraceae bacterium]
MNELFIRADMNSSISMGHMMRCLSVADSAKERGAGCTIITADEQPEGLIRERGHECIVLGSSWDDMEGELAELEKVIEKHGIKKLLIDSYQVSESYLRKVNSLTDVYYLDDLNSFLYPVHAVINYANYATDSFYPVRFPGTLFYLGCGYAPLREAFKSPVPKKINFEVKNLLVMSGGSDPFGILGKILNVIPAGRYNDINVICGNYNEREEELRAAYENDPSVHIYSHVQKIWELYEQADIAISAGGSTLYELSSMGVPTITYSFVDNQIPNVRSFDTDELMPCAGDVRGGNVPARIAELLDRVESYEYRTAVSRRLQSVVDGKGADRLAALLL